jgi:hypothetical protein
MASILPYRKRRGLLVVLDPDQIRGPIAKPDRVRLSKPDGASFTLPVDEVQTHGGVVALFFSSIDKAEVPRGSVIESCLKTDFPDCE